MCDSRGLWSQSHNQVTRKPAALPGEASFPDPVLLSFEHSTVQRNGPQPKEKDSGCLEGRPIDAVARNEVPEEASS
ncbi:hypothetical protein LEMLEM_LOCUS5543 [Lemmus lemmus]